MSEFQDDIPEEILSVLTTSTFKKLLSSQSIKIAEINAVSTLLLKAKIPFNLSFSTGTRRIASAVKFTIYVKPNTTIDIELQFESGSTSF
ncbi:hypothetical protein [Natronospora cellulosivora (SeqCode)]